MPEVSNMPTTLAQQAYHAVRDMIAEQELQPGVWLRKRTIAARLNMSTTPLVEAFRRLEQEGLLEVVPQWGVRVRALTVDELEQVLLMRRALEAVVFRRLAENVSQLTDKLELLSATAVELDRKIQADTNAPDSSMRQPGHTRRDDYHFHLALAEISGLTIVSREIDRLWLLPATAQMFTVQESLELTHVELLAAITSGDATAAEEAIRRHVDHKLRYELPILRRRFGDGPIVFEQ